MGGYFRRPKQGPEVLSEPVAESFPPPPTPDPIPLIESASMAAAPVLTPTSWSSSRNTFVASGEAMTPTVIHEHYDLGMQTRTFREAVEVILREAPTMPGLSLALDEWGFRSLNRSVRDIDDVTRLNMLNRAEWLSMAEPLANRSLSIRTDLVVSEGFDLQPDLQNADNLSDEVRKDYEDQIQRVLDDHWRLNDWEDRLFDRVFDLGVTGEAVRQVPRLALQLGGETFRPGRFRCGAIIPHYVNKVLVDPWDAERLVRLYLQPGVFEHKDPRELILKIVQEDHFGENAGRITGDCFFIAVNRRVGQSRGISDLAPAMDWMDLYDGSLLSDVERAKALLKFVWDVELEGASTDSVKAWAKEMKASMIKAGGIIRPHNEKEKWNAVSPNLQVQETKDLREDIFLYAWGAMGLPRHWYVDAENVNKANAEQMVSPTFAWARSRRRLVKDWLLLEHRYAIQVALESGRLQVPRQHVGIKIVSRDPNRDQYEPTMNAMKSMGEALTILTQGGLMTQKDAAGIVRTVAGAFGFDLMDPAEAEKVLGATPENPMQQAMNEVKESLNRNRWRLERKSA